MTHSEIPEVRPDKTWKREVAIAQLVFLGGLYLYGLYEPASPAFETAESLKVLIFTFAGGAFALDWQAKQAR
jgi:hypothetical protein